MAVALKSWITRLDFREKLYSGLIGMLFQRFEHFRPVLLEPIGLNTMPTALWAG